MFFKKGKEEKEGQEGKEGQGSKLKKYIGDLKSFFNYYFDEKMFHHFCLLIIFMVLSILYIIKFVDITQHQATLIGGGLFILTVSDFVENGFEKKIRGRWLYIIGLGVIIITPYIKNVYIERFNIDSILITLIGLLIIFFWGIVNKANNINKERNLLNQEKKLDILIEDNEKANENFDDLLEVADRNLEVNSELNELIEELSGFNSKLYSLINLDKIDKERGTEMAQTCKNILEKMNKIKEMGTVNKVKNLRIREKYKNKKIKNHL